MMERETLVVRIDYCYKCEKAYQNLPACPVCSEDTRNIGWYETEDD